MSSNSLIVSATDSFVTSVCTEPPAASAEGTVSPFYAGHVAVAVTLVLAQIHVEASGELSAEDVVQQVEREIVGVLARHRQVSLSV